jgi:hypothetical protein
VRQLSANSVETPFANYQQSKLTRMLEEVLGGNCATVCLATINGDASRRREAAATVKLSRHLRGLF